MAVLLRNARTGLFYAGYHTWRLYPEQGFDFQSFKRATDWASTTQLGDVEVIQLLTDGALQLDRQIPRTASPGQNSEPTEWDSTLK
jgi:hypothetical protein